jgi:hypothetical protein
VWIFGYLRMAPLALFLFGVAAAAILVNTTNIGFGAARYLGAVFVIVFIAVPFILDRSPILDPVDYVEFGIRVRVKRLAGNRMWEIGRIQSIEFKEVAGEDYDEQRQRGSLTQLTIRLRHAWPSPRLLINDAARQKIAAWAAAHGIPTVSST